MITREESIARRTKCQHCSVTIAPTAVSDRWMGLDDRGQAVGPNCAWPDRTLMHKPMPSVEVAR